jgi:NADH-quinone oxidoreductase subunit I
MKQYLWNIIEAVVTIAKGMGVTLRVFFGRPETVQYPEIDPLNPSMPGYKGHLGPVQERFRGVLTIESKSCIADHLCERTCPIDCLQIDDVRGPKLTAPNLLGGKDMPKSKHVTRFDIHIGRCMLCGLCVDVCPTGAIHFTREFAAASGDYKNMVRHFIPAAEKEQVLKMAAEEETRKKAEEAKKAAEGGTETKPANPPDQKKEGES